MKEARINWYSMNLHQKVEEHEPVDLEQAIKIVDQYLAHGREKFISDNEALAATMFGFSKSKSEFIEICINGPKQISYKFVFSNPNASWLQKLQGNGTFQREEVLNTHNQLLAKVTEFFSLSSEQIIQECRGKPNRTSRSPLGNRPDASIGTRIFTIILCSILGLFLAYITLRGIATGKIPWPSKHSSTIWVNSDRSPTTFFILTAIYALFSIWMLRGCMLELKTVRKMIKERREMKTRTTGS